MRRRNGAATSLGATARHWTQYGIAAVGGFVAAYLIVVLFVFPPGAPPVSSPVPSVVGLTYDEAVTRLSTSGFGASKGESHENGAPKTTVLAQTPTAGTSTPHGTKVVLDLSAGPPKDVPADSASSTESSPSSSADDGTSHATSDTTRSP